MSEKESSHDESSHHEQEKAAPVPKQELGAAPARRQSVALNIVENPLKVSSSCSLTCLLTLTLLSSQRSSKEQTITNARAFAEAHGMAEHAALFGRAALVARDSERFEMLNDLDEQERASLIYERDHKWHGPKMLWYSIALCAMGAATQGILINSSILAMFNFTNRNFFLGWDQTGSNGANLSFPQEFGIAGKGRDEWIVGVINAIIFLTAGLM